MRCWVLLGALALPAAHAAEPVTMRICANQSLGEPSERNSAYALARLVFERMPEVQVRYVALPWQRCLREAGGGQFDAVLAASHSPERALGLVYPTDAAGQPDPSRRMFQVGYVLFKRKDSPVRWDGSRFHGTSTKPGEAIGAERGYSIVNFARDHGAVVEDRYPNYGSLVDALRLRRTAGVLINQEGAAVLLAAPEWSDTHELGGPPLAPKAYYLPVSRAWATAHPELTEKLWAAVAAARQQPAFRQQFSLNMSAGRRRDLQP